MKLNKLLPIVGLTPLSLTFITACNQTFDFSYNLNVKESEFKLNTKQLDPSQLPSDNVTKFYFDKIYANHNILADDMAYGSYSVYYIDDKYDELSLSINLFDNPNTKNFSFSFSFNLHCKYKDETIKDYAVTFKNVGYSIENLEVWSLQPAVLSINNQDEQIKFVQDHNSSIKSSVTTIDLGGTRTETVTLNLLPNDKDIKSKWEQWITWYELATFASWYLEKCNG